MEPGPTELRATLELFKFYRPEVGIYRLLEDAGITHMSPRQVYHAVHNRPPDTLAAALVPSQHNMIDTFIAALSSVEFQENLAAHLLRSFPEKRRVFFVHIPKTAGVDLASHLISRYPSISTTLLDRNLTVTPEQIFLAVKHLVLEISHSDSIFISGHTHLGTYQKWLDNGIRFQDQVFTVVREPLDQIQSQINYTLMRIRSEEYPMPPDTAGWRREFGVESPDLHASRDAVMELARRILRHQGVVVPNVMCTFLGGGSYQQAVLNTLAHDLEVVDLKRLDAWAEQKWNIAPATRLNSSEKFVSMKDFPSDDLDYARSIVNEDVQYYRDVMHSLERHHAPSIKGNQIID